MKLGVNVARDKLFVSTSFYLTFNICSQIEIIC